MLQKFFLPFDYQRRSPPTLVPGQPRQFARFNLNVTFANETTFRIPFRDTNLPEQDVAKGVLSCFDIKARGLSLLNVTVPLVPVNDNGMDVIVDLEMQDMDVTSSLTKKELPFLTARSFKVDLYHST